MIDFNGYRNRFPDCSVYIAKQSAFLPMFLSLEGNELALLEQSLIHTTSLCDNSPNIFIVVLD